MSLRPVCDLATRHRHDPALHAQLAHACNASEQRQRHSPTSGARGSRTTATNFTNFTKFHENSELEFPLNMIFLPFYLNLHVHSHNLKAVHSHIKVEGPPTDVYTCPMHFPNSCTIKFSLPLRRPTTLREQVVSLLERPLCASTMVLPQASMLASLKPRVPDVSQELV